MTSESAMQEVISKIKEIESAKQEKEENDPNDEPNFDDKGDEQ